jgi:hypothetical protein
MPVCKVYLVLLDVENDVVFLLFFSEETINRNETQELCGKKTSLFFYCSHELDLSLPFRVTVLCLLYNFGMKKKSIQYFDHGVVLSIFNLNYVSIF